MLKQVACAALIAVSATAVSAAALPTVAPLSVEALQGPRTGFLPDRSNPDSALAPGGAFFSLGFGGYAVFDFGMEFKTATVSVTETTFFCPTGSFTCDNHAESADVLVASSYVAGSEDFSGFTQLANIGNVESISELAASGVRFVLVRDTSPAGTLSFDGFDIDSVSLIDAVPVPLPASALMLLGALAGIGLVRKTARRA